MTLDRQQSKWIMGRVRGGFERASKVLPWPSERHGGVIEENRNSRGDICMFCVSSPQDVKGCFAPNCSQPTRQYELHLDESYSAGCTMQREPGPLLMFFLQPVDTQQQQFLMFGWEALRTECSHSVHCLRVRSENILFSPHYFKRLFEGHISGLRAGVRHADSMVTFGNAMSSLTSNINVCI